MLGHWLTNESQVAFTERGVTIAMVSEFFWGDPNGLVI